VGQVIIIVPQGLASRFETEGGLGGVDTEGNFRKDGNVYTTGNYATAENRADVKVTGGVGAVLLKAVNE
jgi:hypothetical protein